MEVLSLNHWTARKLLAVIQLLIILLFSPFLLLFLLVRSSLSTPELVSGFVTALFASFKKKNLTHFLLME